MILISKRSVNRAVLALSLIGSTHAFANDTTEQEKWDVSQPTGEVHTVKIDTTESTWSNLDVHPNGDTIIFDMLGDLYTMPISGGEATPLLVGYDWNMQATYSPDGKKLHF
ncbi:hypothetical protein [Psychrosphaera algicola]|uniref:Uncharacterized protein n=1 Tax=Psychrosphaera algicola TaxID=3023714 RepID=A0ABT5FCG1_9GAMM|nr:hypothetical protein [Psychrosphaera sp. G1-22]MDC2888261.1 hypothetical protein [Psychrosphaera sp. G1-22]